MVLVYALLFGCDNQDDAPYLFGGGPYVPLVNDITRPGENTERIPSDSTGPDDHEDKKLTSA